MELIIGDKTSVAFGDFGDLTPVIMSELEGRKAWKSPMRLQFETSEHNLRVLRANFPELDPNRGALTASVEVATIDAANFPFRMPPRDYQLSCFQKLRELLVWAMFSDPGTGKTKAALDIASDWWTQGLITGILVLSSPKGVHHQWIEEQIPQHLWNGIPLLAGAWDGKKPPQWLGKPSPGILQVFSGNIEMLVHERSLKVLWDFVRVHKDRCLILVDESDSIKNLFSARNKSLRRMADALGVKRRGIMTGTPIAKDLTDEWSQFYFLNPDIIGHKYKTAFMAQFCRMGGFENRSVVGHRNLDEFKKLTAPYIFRATKDQLNLPPKVYDQLVFDMTDEQVKMIASIRETFVAQIGSTDDRTIANSAAVAMLRMQQIACGFAVGEDGVPRPLQSNPRFAALSGLLHTSPGCKWVVWSRFVYDIELQQREFGPRAVAIYGAVSPHDRMMAKERFINDPSVDILLGNDAMAKGVDGLQAVCSRAIYYSNSFNAITRWQSEDRIHRIGQRESAIYFDLIARGSPDRAIIRNLKAKKSLSDLVLDDKISIIKGDMN